MEYEKQVKALRCCMISGPLDDFGCKECPLCGKESCLYGKDGLLAKCASAIEELMAQVKDKDYLIQQQADEIERLRRDVKKQQEKMIELAKRLPHWVSVEERLPDDSRDVIIFTASRIIGVGSFIRPNWYQWYSGGGLPVDVTHWMPLPEPPKEDA